MATKNERNLQAIIVLLLVLLLAALGGWGYHYSKIAGFDIDKKEALAELTRKHQIDMGVVESNLKTAETKLKIANEKIEKFGEKERAYSEKIAELRESLKKKGQNLIKAANAPSLPGHESVGSLQITKPFKNVVKDKIPTIKKEYKHKPPKKMKPSQVKRAVHGKKHAKINKGIQGKKPVAINNKAGKTKKPYVSNTKRQRGKIEKTRPSTKAMSLTALCEAGGSDVPFFKNLLRDTTTYGYTAQAWEEKDGSVKRVKILLTSPDMPNVQ